MRKRFGVVEADGTGTISAVAGPQLKPDFLATLLACGMPDVPEKVFVLVKSKAIAKRFGPDYEGFELCYFGIFVDNCDIRTGVPLIGSETEEGIEFKMVVWARAVSWSDAWAYFVNFYDASAKLWRMATVRIEMDKPEEREEIGHKLVDGQKLAFAQFEGYIEAAVEASFNLSLNKDDFRMFAFQAVEKMVTEPVGMGASRQRPSTFKLERLRECFKFTLSRTHMNRYLDRDKELEAELEKKYYELLASR